MSVLPPFQPPEQSNVSPFLIFFSLPNFLPFALLSIKNYYEIFFFTSSASPTNSCGLAFNLVFITISTTCYEFQVPLVVVAWRLLLCTFHCHPIQTHYFCRWVQLNVHYELYEPLEQVSLEKLGEVVGNHCTLQTVLYI